MSKLSTDPKQFLTDFFTSFNDDLVHTDDDPGVIIDRYHTPDICQIADGHRMDREKLVAHVRPVRKNRPQGRMEVHEALTDGRQIAARYTLHVQIRKKALDMDVFFFGEFTDEGRMRRAHMLTRAVSADGEGHGEGDGDGDGEGALEGGGGTGAEGGAGAAAGIGADTGVDTGVDAARGADGARWRPAPGAAGEQGGRA